MKKLITTVILLAVITLNVFAQQEIPMFFDSELGLATDRIGLFSQQVAYSPDKSRIATVYNNGRIIIWDATTGREIHRLSGHGDVTISGIVFSRNGRHLASFARYDTLIKIWDVTSGELIRNITQGGVQALSFNHDGSRLVGSFSGLRISDGIKIWNTTNGYEVRALVGHTEIVRSVEYSPDGRRILTSSNDGSIKIWDSENGQIIRTIVGNGTETIFINAVFSPNGRYIATYVNEWYEDTDIDLDIIRILNAETGQEIRSIPARLDYNVLAFSPDSRQLLINARVERNTIIKIFDVETSRELQSFNNTDFAVAFHSDGRNILTASASFRLTTDGIRYGASYANILDAATGRKVGVIGYGPLNIGAKAFADLQIARFLNDTAAVSRNESILNFIVNGGYATRAEIEAFYRNGINAASNNFGEIITVSNVTQWNNAINTIRNGGHSKKYTIEITNNFSVPGYTNYTFGNVIDVEVLIRGRYTLSLSGNGTFFLGIGTMQTVIMQDITIRGRTTDSPPLVIIEGFNALFIMRGNATITGNTGGGVRVANGSFAMTENSTVTGNSTLRGGGVEVREDNLFFMQDNASISGNKANFGGGVFIGKGSVFNMEGNASVSHNEANQGGGVQILEGTINMQGRSSVSNNTATILNIDTENTGRGGGVEVLGGIFNILGNASVSGNKASRGGGIVIMTSVFTMNDNVSVSGNRAENGGGIYIESNTITGNDLTMNGGSISGNSAVGPGGGVAIGVGTFTMNNGTISGNNAGVVGGGVSLAYGSFRIVGGTVYGNTASPTTLRNTAGQSGAAVFAVREVDAQRGRFDARGNWVSMGNLPTTSNTINVVNGELR